MKRRAHLTRAEPIQGIKVCLSKDCLAGVQTFWGLWRAANRRSQDRTLDIRLSQPEDTRSPHSLSLGGSHAADSACALRNSVRSNGVLLRQRFTGGTKPALDSTGCWR